MRLAAHQPHYLPWLRYFHKIAQADVFVVMDDIQFNRNGWQNRTRIKHAQGWTYLSVPVFQKFKQRISEVRIDNTQRWKQKHWKALTQSYGRARYLHGLADRLEPVYARDWALLGELSEELLRLCLDMLNVQTRMVRSSELNVDGNDSIRLVNICRALGADTYLSGAYAIETYLDKGVFEEAGIEIAVQRWCCPVYGQLHPAAGFIPDLSIVDLLFNHGPESLAILLQRQHSA
jgi:hypothetical protein